ncbi:MoaD/ThiS family protein [Intrasporangium sp.]|uniref:MoaD/ThiS family protein n=1 Tax=Intrasporangium sp. TaxID=1925024 RepID=UPI0029397E5F|nr:MoaD/ThiS family protein [Intrasporangium sp.]MDV3222099.1 MoaD/ThiS family protein [Intrasporangium sp.]
MGETGSAEQTVTVRYWAAARQAAGVDSEHVALAAGGTVSDVVAAAVGAHPDLERVARVATFLVDGRAADREAVLPPGATLEMLPPFAGG